MNKIQQATTHLKEQFLLIETLQKIIQEIETPIAI